MTDDLDSENVTRLPLGDERTRHKLNKMVKQAREAGAGLIESLQATHAAMAEMVCALPIRGTKLDPATLANDQVFGDVLGVMHTAIHQQEAPYRMQQIAIVALETYHYAAGWRGVRDKPDPFPGMHDERRALVERVTDLLDGADWLGDVADEWDDLKHGHRNPAEVVAGLHDKFGIDPDGWLVHEIDAVLGDVMGCIPALHRAASWQWFERYVSLMATLHGAATHDPSESAEG